MAEIKTHLYALDLCDGESYWVIGPKHTVNDILRHVLNEVGGEELAFLATEIARETSDEIQVL